MATKQTKKQQIKTALNQGYQMTIFDKMTSKQKSQDYISLLDVEIETLELQ